MALGGIPHEMIKTDRRNSITDNLYLIIFSSTEIQFRTLIIRHNSDHKCRPRLLCISRLYYSMDDDREILKKKKKILN